MIPNPLFDPHYETSIFDSDLYKFTMGQLVHKYFNHFIVTYKLTFRENQKLTSAKIDVNQLKKTIHNINTKETCHELEFLQNMHVFDAEYLDFLRNINLPEVRVYTDQEGTVQVEVEGPWETAIYWETPILATISELYSVNRYSSLPEREKVEVEHSLEDHLNEHIRRINRFDSIKITEFGTRRRFSRLWQHHVVRELKNKIGNKLAGTSNVQIASDQNIPCGGTMAHELFMIKSAIDINENGVKLKDSMKSILDLWKEMYPESLRIVLPDTYRTKPFVETVLDQEEFTHSWRGFRHDSGDPDEFMDILFTRYGREVIKNKTTIFSDALDMTQIENLYNRYAEKTNCVFGWGTGLTNSCTIPFLNMVFKPVRVRSQKGISYLTIKESDTPGKGLGPLEELAKYK